MSLAYFAMYITLAAHELSFSSHPSSSTHPFVALLQSLLSPSLQSSWNAGSLRFGFVSVLYALVLAECISRVRSRFHSWNQIIVGFLIGSADGALFYSVCMPAIREACREIKPIGERSREFGLAVAIGMTVCGALILGQISPTHNHSSRSLSLSLPLCSAHRHSLIAFLDLCYAFLHFFPLFFFLSVRASYSTQSQTTREISLATNQRQHRHQLSIIHRSSAHENKLTAHSSSSVLDHRNQHMTLFMCSTLSYNQNCHSLFSTLS